MGRQSPYLETDGTTLFGMALWFVNFNILAVPIGRPWFAEAPAIPQSIYNAFFFGSPLGIYLATRLPVAPR